MIDIICRVKYNDLYARMQESALRTARCVTPGFITQIDDGQPKIAESYNRLGSISRASILVFVHDDVEFLSDGWDVALLESDHEINGVIGTVKYEGGRIFHAGTEYGRGKYVSDINGEKAVKIMSPCRSGDIIAAVDGMFMAVKRDHFARHKFDQNFDGLFFYDLDYCLGHDCGIADILIGHYKPKEYFGVYPKDMKPIGNYWGEFHAKHGLNPKSQEDQAVGAVPLDDYLKIGHEQAYKLYKERCEVLGI